MTTPTSWPSAADLLADGLCSSCTYSRVVESSRGSVFVMCGLAKTLPDFVKYPLLPVLQCSGYSPIIADGK